MLRNLFFLGLGFFLCWLISVTLYNPVSEPTPSPVKDTAITVRISDMPMMNYREVR
jgi:hypothetical protein